jgi:dCTP deaminase
MILTSERIEKELRFGRIKIDPFDQKRLNPNSVNLQLHPRLLVYDELVLDARNKNRHKEIIIPDDGFVLQPNVLYLGSTVEYTETHQLVPKIDGRSSMGRLGIFVHVTAGFGDIGFCGHWTLEIVAVHPVRIYPYLEICQISYHEIIGLIGQTYTGKYQNNQGVQPCMIHKELGNSSSGI